MGAPASACWVVTDGAAGNEKQALALARALGFEPRVLRIRLRTPWRWLAPFGPSNALIASQRDWLAPPWPSLAIGCGRASALATLGIKTMSGGSTRIVQILDPRHRRNAFDLVVAPEHDGVAGDNVITCLGALSEIDDGWLADGRSRFPVFASLPAPRTAVLVGGPVRGVRFGRRYVDALLARLAHWHARDGGSFLVTCSRRTPAAMATHLRRAFAAWPGTFWANPEDGDNPYAGLLGWADRVVVTPDSTNLLSEACATGAPVLAHMPAPPPGKLGRFVRTLIESGRLRPLRLEYQPWRYEPLRELPRVAAAVRDRLALPQP